MAEFAEIESGVVINVAFTDTDMTGFPGVWVDVTGMSVAKGWTTSDGGLTFDPPVPVVITRYLLTGPEWVQRFTDAEWAWLKGQRALDTAAGRQLDKFMDAIRWTDSIDVSSPNVDPFYNWLLANGIPGGQGRIDELRAGEES